MGAKTYLLFVLVIFSMLTQKLLAQLLPDLCLKDIDLGDCTHEYPRWWFNKTSGNCETFHYSGCGGNDNNFIEYGDCCNTCKYVTTTAEPCLWNMCNVNY